MMVHVYVEDVDTVFKRALEAGAKELRPVEDRFYGDRAGSFEDPFGHQWHIATHVEDVPLDELRKRAEEAAGQSQLSSLFRLLVSPAGPYPPKRANPSRRQEIALRLA